MTNKQSKSTELEEDSRMNNIADNIKWPILWNSRTINWLILSKNGKYVFGITRRIIQIWELDEGFMDSKGEIRLLKNI